MNNAFNLMVKYKKVKKNMLGYLKATEVTVNKKDGSYNQHLHVLVFVKSSYFVKSENYISQAELTDFWKKALKIDYTPVVNVKAVKPKATEKEKGGNWCSVRNCKVSCKIYRLFDKRSPRKFTKSGRFRKRVKE